MKNTPRIITVVLHPSGYADIHEGEFVGQGLNYDELLGEIARLGAPITSSYLPAPRGRYMRHIDDVLAWRERMRKRRAEDFQEVSP